jgi:hypothetical protein
MYIEDSIKADIACFGYECEAAMASKLLRMQRGEYWQALAYVQIARDYSELAFAAAQVLARLQKC